MDKNFDLDQSLDIISSHAYIIAQELKDGVTSGYFDEKLVFDLSKAFLEWRSRVDMIEKPYCVWFFNGTSWSKVTKGMYQEDAYKEWYRFTRGGKLKANSKSDTYYYLGLSSEVLTDRHPTDSEEDDFSIKYLLNKSFGE